MLCRLLTAKSLSEPMLIYCQMDVKEHISVSSVIYIKIIKISFRKCNAKCLQNDIGFSYQSSVYWIGFRTIVFAVKIIIMDLFLWTMLSFNPYKDKLYVIKSIIKCKMKLLNHSSKSTVQPLKFGMDK